MSAFMNALREEGTKEDCLQQIGRLLDERATYKARLAEAVEVVRDVTPALIAAISLLERGGKKAAASDKMFAQMLADYSASVERARDLLAKLEGQS